MRPNPSRTLQAVSQVVVLPEVPADSEDPDPMKPALILAVFTQSLERRCSSSILIGSADIQVVDAIQVKDDGHLAIAFVRTEFRGLCSLA